MFFAVFSSVLAWDWLMSIDYHWFSTLYGWYVFAGMWVSAMTTAVVLTLYLKSKGYLPQVNNSHIHDMGKWVFAVSFCGPTSISASSCCTGMPTSRRR